VCSVQKQNGMCARRTAHKFNYTVVGLFHDTRVIWTGKHKQSGVRYQGCNLSSFASSVPATVSLRLRDSPTVPLYRSVGVPL